MGMAQIAFAFEQAAAAVPAVRNQAGGMHFEAGSQARRTLGWRAPTASANDAILGSLTTLRDRSRAAARNDGYAKGAIEKMAANIIGTGVKPLSMAPDPRVREAIHRTWTAWTDQSDADGLLDFYGQQMQLARTWLEGGEAFARLRDRLPGDGLTVPLQVQILEPELCPHTHSVVAGAQRIRAGIEFSPIGRRTAYWFHPSRPELDDYDATLLRRVPAEAVAHVYDPLRPGQLRGLPLLTQALIALHELSKYADAVLVRQQLSNLFVGFVTRPEANGAAETLHPLTGETVETDAQGDPLIKLAPGVFQELNPGEKVEFSDPPDANGYADFMRQKLFEVAAATGVPYEVLTGDMSKVNDRTVRVILHEFRRKVQAWQHQVIVFQFCRRVWRAWMDRAFLVGALPLPADYAINPEPWLAVRWMPQSWPYLHPVQDVQAMKDAVRDGFKSRSQVVAEQGEDAEAVDIEQASDNARADGLGLRYDSDGRTSASAAAPPPTPESGDDPATPAPPAGAQA